MTDYAKKEAEELIEEFCSEIGASDFHIPEFISGIPCADGSKEYEILLEEETRALAKNIALICVNKMLAIERKYSNFGAYEHLQEVKSEIENDTNLQNNLH